MNINLMNHTSLLKNLTLQQLKFILAFIGISMLFGFKSCTSSQQIKTDQNMAYSDYEELWKAYFDLRDEGKYQDALTFLTSIEDKAIEDKNEEQRLKTWFVRFDNINPLDESPLINQINYIEEHISELNATSQAIANSYLAEVYNRYFQQNRYKLRNLTDVSGEPAENIQQWTIRQLLEKVEALYLMSISDRNTTDVSIETYNALIEDLNENGKSLRTTIYDLLAHRAIDHFNSIYANVTKPVDAFVFDHEEAFAQSKIFSTAEINSPDPHDKIYRVLQVLQELEGFHQNSNRPILDDIVLKRLQFTYKNGIHDRKSELYVNALNDVFQNAESNAAFEAARLVVEYHTSQAEQRYWNQEETADASNTHYQEAIKMIDSAIEKLADKEHQSILNALKSNITRPQSSFNAEQVYPINQSFPILIKFRNLEQIDVKIFALPEAELIKYYEDNKIETHALAKNQVRKTTYKFPATTDHNWHSIECIEKPLENGGYILELNDNQGNKSSQILHISNISYSLNNNQFIQVSDRISGEPLDASISQYNYEWKGRDRKLRKGSKGQASTVGIYTPEKSKNRASIYRLENDGDVLFLNNYISIYNHENREQTQKLYGFTDRSIYRPGQKVYYKAIFTDHPKGEEPKVLSNESFQIILRDANYQEVAKQNTRTNEFGSIHGSFDLPTSLLNGNFTIELKSKGNIRNQLSVSVEEYKRPKFLVETEPITEKYKLNEEIALRGTAKSFASSPIDNAVVSFKVTRSQPYRYYYRYYNPAPSKIIATGSTKTNPDGTFDIDFIAEPDLSNKQENPVFTYQINIQVTDISGETRTTSTYISAGKQYFLLNMPSEQRFYGKGKHTIPISLTNQNSDPASGTVKIKVEALDAPSKTKINTYWNSAEFYHNSQSEYESLLPFYAYGKTGQKEDWKIVNELVGESIEISDNLDYELPNLSSGHYKITVEQDNAITASSFIEIVTADKTPVSIPLAISSDEKVYQPGDQAKVSIYSAYENMVTYVDILRVSGTERRQVKTVKGSNELIIPISKADRGGVLVYVSSVHQNRHYTEFKKLDVPYLDKKLSFQWEYFRSDLLPGSQEKWRLRITDNKSQPVIAEVLSSIYDASLDQFRPHSWNPFSLNEIRNWFNVNPYGFEEIRGIAIKVKEQSFYDLPSTIYPRLNTRLFGNRLESVYAGGRGKRGILRSSAPPPVAESAMEDSEGVEYDEVMVTADKSANKSQPQARTPEVQKAEVEIPVRKNLNETVFFLPALTTNQDGETILEFTMNEALTTWKFQTFAHTTDMKFHLDTKSLVTSKDLMVFPSGPRFFRESDRISLPAKVQNMSKASITASVDLKIYDALSGREVTSIFTQEEIKRSIEIEAERSKVVHWELSIPKGIEAIKYTISAKAGSHTDGEENSALILPNRKLVTESLAISIPASDTKKVTIPSIDRINTSITADPHLYQVSITSNPSWLAIQSLPYLMEYPHKCTEQVFARYFANRLGAYILEQNPEIEDVYNSWKNKDQLISALNKNEELKSAILQQTPWVMDALSEEEQMQRLALLFDLKKIESESREDLSTIQQRQNGGGFPWFPGGRPNWYITQYMLEGFGQLDKMGVIDRKDGQFRSMIEQALQFLEKEVEEYDRRRTSIDYLSPIIVHYLYVRSFYPEHEASRNGKKLIEKYAKRSQDLWLDQGILSQGHLALYFHRNNDKEWSNKIIESLRQRTIFKDDLGRYWKEVNGYFWHESAIENQALLIAAFDEITADTRSNNDEIDQMKQWLLGTKRTNSWKSTKATTHAVYALIQRGEKWISNDELVTLEIAGEKQDIPVDKLVEATGQYEVVYRNDEITDELQKVEFTNPNDHIAWGSTTTQYWEDLDKIKSYQETPLKLRRTYYIKLSTDSGDELIKLEGGETLAVGDLLTVRIQLVVDRPMEFIHLQDLRASGTEPIDVLSRYQWKGGLGYYMETRDAATNFFVDYLPTGEYTLEYDQRATQTGYFSAGLATIQSMYAPEFGAQSEGIKLQIQE